MRRQHLVFIFLWTLCWVLFFAGVLLGQTRLPNGDLSGQFHTFSLFQAQEMMAGRLPVWSPGSYGGFPFAADTQAAVFYPLRWFTILLSSYTGFSYYVLELEGLIHIWMAGLFTYILAYHLTNNRWAGLLAAISFGLGGYLTSYPLLQLAVLETITWLPLILWLIRHGVQNSEKRPLPWFLAAALVSGLSFTAGHPQTFLHLSCLTAVYYLFLTINAGWSWQWLVGMGGVIGGTAVSLAAAAWLPALHYLTYTTRYDVSYNFVSTGFPLLDYLQIWMPGLFSFWVPMYSGITTITLLIAGWFTPTKTDNPQKTEIPFWGITALLLVILSLGDKGLLFEPLYRLIPGFALFRQQERLAGLLSLVVALLAAQTFTLWQQSETQTRNKALKQIATFSATVFLVAVVVVAIATKDNWQLLAGQQTIFLSLSLLILWHGGKRWSGLLFILLLSLDLFLAARQPLDLQPQSPQVFWPQPMWLSLLAEDEPGRIDSNGLFHLNLGELSNLEDIRGLSPLKMEWINQIDDLPPVRRWQLLNVTHVISTSPPKDVPLHEVASIPTNLLPGEPFEGVLYRFADALPRAWLVYEPVLANDTPSAFEIIGQPTFDPAQQVVLTEVEDAAAWTAVFPPPNQTPPVKTTRLSPNTLQLDTNTPTPAILVISEWNYPGWQVSINGAPATTATANAAFQAVLLPAGEHHIVLRFMSVDVYFGILLSLFTIFMVGFLFWRWQPVIQSPPRTIDKTAWQLDFGRLWHSAQPWRKTTSSQIILFILLLGFGLRLFHLGHQELRGDEAFSYLFARLPAGEIIPALISEGDPHSPLHYLLLHGWMSLAGDSEFAMRYPSVIPGILLLPLLYNLGITINGRQMGLLLVFLAAVSQSLIWLSQDVRNQYTLVLFFGTLSTVLLIQKLVPQPGFSRRVLLLWLLYGVVTATAVYSHYYGLFIVAAHALYLWWMPTNRTRYLITWLLAGLTAVLLFAPWFLATWSQLLAAGQLSEPAQPELAVYLVDTGIELTLGSGLDIPTTRWLFAAVLPFALLGLRALWQQKPAWGVLIGGWWIGTTLFIYLIRFSRATFNTFYISIAAPAWWFLVAIGLLLLWQQQKLRWRIWATIGLGVILVANGVSLKNYYFNPAYSRTLGYREMANHLAAQAEAGDIFLAHFPDPSLHYYLRHVDIPTTLQPTSAEDSQTEVESALFDLSQQTKRIWFVPYNSTAWDAENIVPRWLDYHTLSEERFVANQLTLWAYRPLPTIMEQMTAQEKMFGQQIQLAGAYVTVNGRPTNLENPISIGTNLPSEVTTSTIAVTLLWQALAEIPESYTVFVHLLAEDGRLVTQHDGIPMFGTRPTTTWQPGELFVDRHEMVLPVQAVGNGRLTIGLYHSQTLVPLLTAQGEQSFQIGTVTD